MPQKFVDKSAMLFPFSYGSLSPAWATIERIRTGLGRFSVYSLCKKMIASSFNDEKKIGLSPKAALLFMMRSKMGAAFILHEMTFSDGPAINALAAECPDGGLISVRSVFRENAWHSLKALRPNTVGMAAEAAGHDWLIGMCLVSFGLCRVDGVTVPYALLNTLMVHPKWRREGVAGHLAD
jgi:hypothetical protein